ncbi:hypothetical protein GQ54DRAFT_196583 [Martensiomyces pterosporus]|nr:hypothetical protein GQ54DRAFT_196583 [Martensiomyces pterosporus]
MRELRERIYPYYLVGGVCATSICYEAWRKHLIRGNGLPKPMCLFAARHNKCCKLRAIYTNLVLRNRDKVKTALAVPSSLSTRVRKKTMNNHSAKRLATRGYAPILRPV